MLRSVSGGVSSCRKREEGVSELYEELYRRNCTHLLDLIVRHHFTVFTFRQFITTSKAVCTGDINV